MTAWLRVATLIAGLAIAPSATAQPTPATADELAAAKRDGVSCKSLDDAERFLSPTLARVTAKACRRDRWKLEVVVCFLRDVSAFCDEALPARARGRYRKDLDRVEAAVEQERRLWAIESARKAGILGNVNAQPGAAFSSLTAADHRGDLASGLDAPAQTQRWTPPAPTPEELAAKAARDAIETWAQAAYDRCTDKSRNLAITVTITASKCTDLKVGGERRTGPHTTCLRQLCNTADWSKVPDIVHTGRGRTGPTDWSK